MRKAARSRRRDNTREAILAAGLRCFARDGYRRTALERVAGEAGISRAALYLHFASKEDLFRALVAALHARSLAEAAVAADGPSDLAERLTATIVAKSGPIFDLLRGSEHAQEFLDENHRLCGRLSADAAAKHARLLARMLSAADGTREISLAARGSSAAQAAELLLAVADGIKARGRTTLSTAEYRKRVGQAVRIVVTGLAPAGRRRTAGPIRATAAAPMRGR